MFLALCLVLAVVSAQDTCSQDMMSALPALEKLYMDYNNNNWAAVEGDLERFIPTIKLILADCANYTIPDTPRVQACIENVKTIARLIVPVLVDPNNQTTLLYFLEQLPLPLTQLYTQCINPQAFEAKPALPKLNKFSVPDIFKCTSSISRTFPDLKRLVIDIKPEASLVVLKSDISNILRSLKPVYAACGIPEPSVKLGLVNEELCARDAENLASIAKDILNSQGNISKMLASTSVLIQSIPAVLVDCGLKN